MSKPITYREAGVDIERADHFVHQLGQWQGQTQGKFMPLQAFGLFAAGLDLSGYRKPTLFVTCDGIGTKWELLHSRNLLEVAGRDLVAMSVNDILTTGAHPALFLDYLGVDRIDGKKLGRVIAGIVEALRQCECLLAGGETAEMADFLSPQQMELAGFCVGLAERDQVIDPQSVTEGDVILGLPSASFHANGWSLVRKVIAENSNLVTERDLEQWLAPTRIYYPEVMAWQRGGVRIHAMAHVTGGGVPGNVARVLGERGARIEMPRWELPGIALLWKHVELDEALRTFNMGIGWLAIVAAEDCEKALQLVPEAVVLGEVSGNKLEIVYGGST